MIDKFVRKETRVSQSSSSKKKKRKKKQKKLFNTLSFDFLCIPLIE